MALRSVAVFGSSEPAEDDPLYRQAREVGRLLAGERWTVVTGGYGGVMEAASRGAREAGGRTLGVVSRIFDHREPNPYLDEVRRTDDLFERQRRLVEASDAFVVMWGRAGTLSELSLLWALARAGCLGPRPVILLGERWRPIHRRLSDDGMLETAHHHHTYLASTPLEAVRELARRLPDR